MTALDDLIARLREATGDKAFLSARTIVACHEAAAALEALRDEVARKDAALKEIADTHNDQWQAGRIARAALR